jgi:steroid delta-isomerase-like uncharacterized protein
MSEENKALVRRAWEGGTQHNLDVFDDVYAADAVWHEPDQDLRGLEEVKQFSGEYFQAFPDLSFAAEEVIDAEGNKVVSRWTARGTHQGETEELGLPTGKEVELKGITIHRIENGKIVEEWEQYDNLSFLQQLGRAPEEAQAGSS